MSDKDNNSNKLEVLFSMGPASRGFVNRAFQSIII